jgi:RHS repeat-associated protein
VGDKKEQANGVWQAVVISAKDYYPFGMSMPSRTTEGGTYRYGFNGQERDTELGESVYTAEFWQYSANLGRRWNVDPITFPNISPYATFNDNPIVFTDLSGASPEQGSPVKDTAPSYQPAQGEHLLQEVVITAARMNQAPTSGGSRPSTWTKMAINFVATADAYLSNLLLKPSTFLKPEEYGGGELARIARQGHMVGHSIAIGQGIAEIWGGEGMIGGGGVVTATGVGAAPGIAIMAAGAGTIAHGTTMIAVATHKIVLLQME